uniref:Uncharacterized protein n=1 Tax=Pyrodinium bahamense TaxID=73915 RepID=A0A7S0FAM0_9DINO
MAVAPASPAKLYEGLTVLDDSERQQRSGQLVTWARQCTERAEQFRNEGRGPLAVAQLERCVHHLQLALTVYHGNLSARLFLVGCLMSLGHFATAKEQALHALREISEEREAALQEPLLHLAIAHIATRLGQSEDAIAFSQKAANDYPRHPQPCATLGRALQRTGRHFAAMKMARLALERDLDPACPVRLGERCRQVAQQCAANTHQEDCPEGLQVCAKTSNSPTGLDSTYKVLASSVRKAVFGEGAVAARYGRQGVMNDLAAQPSEGSSSSSCSRPLDPGKRDPGLDPALDEEQRDPRIKILMASGVEELEFKLPFMKLEEEHLGSHIIITDGHAVKATASNKSETIQHLRADTQVRVSAVVLNDEDKTVWGRITEPRGWIPIVSSQTGGRWAKKEATSATAFSTTARTRSLPFGPIGESGAGADFRAAAVSDLERIFSGVMPASRSPLASPKERVGPGVPTMLQSDACAKCYPCCNCRRGCTDP